MNRIGWWTMIYNVGFWARSKSYEFFGQFAYKQREQMRSRHDCVSFCDRTVSSWYKDLKTGKLGCFYAYKIKVFGEEPKSNLFASRDEEENEQDLKKQIKGIKYEDLKFLVEKINSQT